MTFGDDSSIAGDSSFRDASSFDKTGPFPDKEMSSDGEVSDTGLGESSFGESSVTQWIMQLRIGDEAAAHQLWTYLQKRLLMRARSELRRKASPAYDEDDVAQSAFHALCDAIQDGRYEELQSRDELWRLLAVITSNKARNRAAKENSARRGGGLTRVPDTYNFLQSLANAELGAEEELIMREECQRMLTLLHRPEIQQVALLKVDGYTDEEIGCIIGCSRRSVQRRLTLIRDIWSKELGDREE